jgi:hypothetical protein
VKKRPVEKKIRSWREALDVIVSRTVVDTGTATVAGLSDPSAPAVKVAGRTAVAAPLDGEGGGVVALAWPDVV